MTGAQMSNEKKKMRRNFSMIFKLIQIFILMLVVFFLSFFVTIVVKTPHPIDHIKSVYFEDTSADKIIDEYDKERKSKHSSETKNETSKKESTSSKDKNESSSLNKSETTSSFESKKKIDTSTIGGKIERIQSIKQAVNEKIQDNEHYITLDEIPLSLRQAIVAVEDSRFYSHSGFDIGGIARATITNVEAGQIEEGGSTITQQLVKNLFLTQDKSFTRKAEELFLAISMERNFSKDKILELYLNTIYFGSNFYGIYDASIGYFGVEPKELTLAESAMLAGLPNAPSLYSPYVDFMLAKKRQIIVLDAMLKAKRITEREAEKAKIDTIVLAHE